jgi:hypothetical protein
MQLSGILTDTRLAAEGAVLWGFPDVDDQIQGTRSKTKDHNLEIDKMSLFSVIIVREAEPTQPWLVYRSM